MSPEIDKNKSDFILAEVKKLKSQEKILDPEEEKVKLVIFTLAGDYYAFQGEEVKEILPVGKITYVPGSPEVILGILNVRGDIESVLDIHKLMELPSSKITPASRIIIAAKGDIRSGIQVDSVEDVVDIPKSSIQPPLATLHHSIREFAIGQTIYRDRTTVFLSVGKIFEKLTS
ncbi:MAG TPA: chemotaxis protein CheW [Candidatus Limnocylindrales bacterium]|nr:chemotaxis protein CheW [Candidatus Limnocylindrales bacterium]